MNQLEKFYARVEKIESGCWLWKGAISGGTGYGTFTLTKSRKTVLAHRWSYEQFKGPIPKGLHLDHLCRVRNCVNPDHLEAVTQRVNTLRGNSPSAKLAGRTHCKHGHPFDEKNTWYRKEGSRVCRTCVNERRRVKRLGKEFPEAAMTGPGHAPGVRP